VHNHLGRWLSPGDWEAGESPWMIPDVPALLEVMDAHDVELVVNLDGMWGDELTANVERYDAAYPGRFLTFCHSTAERCSTAASTSAAVVESVTAHPRGRAAAAGSAPRAPAPAVRTATRSAPG
jgi:hypothetical protein